MEADMLGDEFVQQAIADASRIQPTEQAVDPRLALVSSWKTQLQESLAELEDDERTLEAAKLDIEEKLKQNRAVADSARGALRILDEYEQDRPSKKKPKASESARSHEDNV